MKSLLMLAAIAVASLSIVSCDDDPWDGPHSWRDDPYGWYGDYGATGAGTTTIGTRAVIVATKTIAVPSWLACSVENGVVTLTTPISMRMAILVLRSLTIRP